MVTIYLSKKLLNKVSPKSKKQILKLENKFRKCEIKIKECDKKLNNNSFEDEEVSI